MWGIGGGVGFVRARFHVKHNRALSQTGHAGGASATRHGDRTIRPEFYAYQMPGSIRRLAPALAAWRTKVGSTLDKIPTPAKNLLMKTSTTDKITCQQCIANTRKKLKINCTVAELLLLLERMPSLWREKCHQTSCVLTLAK